MPALARPPTADLSWRDGYIFDWRPHHSVGQPPGASVDERRERGADLRRSPVQHRQADGDRTGFQGKRYRTEVVGRSGYDDRHDDYIGFLEPRIRETRRVLEPTGSFFLHIDYREAHYCKILLDEIFGRASFMNEIVWAYDYGARSKRKWPAKHDTIFWYARDPRAYTFNFGEMDRIPYMAPCLVGKEKAARGKTPTDVWWHTIVSPTGREKTGYPTQKPLGILEGIVKVHSRPGDTVLDFFAGSGTTGEAAARHGKNYIMVDSNREAARLMAERLAGYGVETVGFDRERGEADQGSLRVAGRSASLDG